MSENALSPAQAFREALKEARSLDGALADLIVKYHRYPSPELARMIRQLQAELAERRHSPLHSVTEDRR